jgi:hypothetical protein
MTCQKLRMSNLSALASYLAATVVSVMMELIDRILSLIPMELPLLHGFQLCNKDCLVSLITLIKYILTHNTASKADWCTSDETLSANRHYWKQCSSYIRRCDSWSADWFGICGFWCNLVIFNIMFKLVSLCLIVSKCPTSSLMSTSWDTIFYLRLSS